MTDYRLITFCPVLFSLLPVLTFLILSLIFPSLPFGAVMLFFMFLFSFLYIE